MLHSEKNLLFSIQILAARAEQERADPSLCLKDVKKIRELTELSLKKTSETLDSIRSLRYQFRENNLIAAIEEALTKTNTEGGACIIWDKSGTDSRLYKCYFDYYHMNQVFTNVLNNATEAIQGTGRKDGSILIKANIQFQWIIVIIQDNGTGIKKADLKRLFVPYSSRKAGGRHWGLGLSYVYKVVKSHRGQIHIETKWGEGTAVQIMLPLLTGAEK
jgi:nitrogen fixation/metabolism regulation signal transduction histidine kinase